MGTNELMEALQSVDLSTNYNRWLYKSIERNIQNAGCVLDVGSGIGSIGRYLGEDGIKQVILSDNCEEMIDLLKSRFRHLLNYQVVKLDIVGEDVRDSALCGKVDAITCINVLEHINEDAKALKNMSLLLRPGGKLLLIVPALGRLYGTLDKLAGHYRRYERGEFNKQLGNSGFVIKEQRFMNFFGIFTWYVAGRMLKQAKFNDKTNRALDKIVPFLEIIDRYLRFPMGQSIVTCCQKV